MKKIIALLLCLALLACGAAVAETDEKQDLGTVGTVSVSNAFDIKCKLPEGYKVSFIESDSSNIIALVSSEDATKPILTLSVAFDDIYTQDGKALRLNDLTEEEAEMLKQSLLEDVSDGTIEESETAYGTKVYIIKAFIGDMNYVSVFSIYKSYLIEAVVVTGSEAESSVLTDDQIQMVIDFFSDMDFVEIKE